MDVTVGTWGRASDVLWRRTGRGTVLTTPHTDEVVLLEGTAERVWDLLERPVRAVDLADALADAYATTRTQILDDVAAALRHLQDADVAVQAGA